MQPTTGGCMNELKCPECGSSERVKNGMMKEMQRYKCKKCSCNYTKSNQRGYPKELKNMALRMYLEGVGFRDIGRILGVSNVTVLYWVKNDARKLSAIRSREPKNVSLMKIDELCTYVVKKTSEYGCGWLLIEIQGKSLGTGSVIVERKP